jgi:hypothetical protein
MISKSSLNKISILTLSLFIVIGCAPKEQDSQRELGPARPVASAAVLKTRDAAFARYLVMQVYETRRLMNTALANPLERVWLSPAKAEHIEKGCRVLKKNLTALQAEKFTLQIPKSCDESNEQFRGKKMGDEVYGLVYAAKLPTKDIPLAQGQAFPFPHTITVKSQGLHFDLDLLPEILTASSELKTRHASKLRIDVDFALIALLVEEDERALTYDVSVQASNYFDYDFYKTIGHGKAISGFAGVRVTIDRKTRQAVGLVTTGETRLELAFESEGAGKTSPPVGLAVNNRVFSKTDLSVLLPEQIAFSQDLCEIADMRFMVRRRGGDDRPVTLSNGVVVLDDTALEPIKLCLASNQDPAFMPLIEGLYY